MPAWEGRSKGPAWGFRFFVTVLKVGGVMPAYVVLRFVTFYYVLFSYRSTKSVLHFFHKLGYSKGTSLLKLVQNYYLFGQTLIDKVVMMSSIRNKFTFNFDGEEHLLKMVELQKGGLLLSAHIGNWEIAGHLLKRLGAPINIVMYDGEQQQIKEYLDSVTGKRSVNVIVIKNDTSHIFKINAALQNNEFVCMHADRFVAGNKTITGNFLGHDAKFPLGPFILAAKFKVPVSFVFAMKESSTHYHFFATPLKDYSSLPKDVVTQQILNDYITEMESKVRQYPEQWYNYYDFWQ